MTGTKTLRRKHRALSLLFGASLLAGCGDYPRDAEDSTQRARSSVMRVGVSHDPPYVVLAHGAEPRGDDIARVRALARTQGSRIEWVTQGHEWLMEELLAYRLHLVAGGHVADSPWQPRVGWSRAWHARGGDGPLRERRFALPPGENAWQLEVDRFLHEHERAAGSRAR
jgi:hypothetical protein